MPSLASSFPAAALLALLAPALQPAAAGAPVSDAPRAAAVWSSSAAPTFVVTSPATTARRLTPVTTTTRAATVTFTVDTARPQQTWWGTGAALTDASVELLASAPAAVDLLFDPAAEGGARLDAVRLPLSSTDFSTTPWTWGWDGTTATPTAQAEAAITTLTDDVLPLRPDLRVVGAAWSAPAELKTSRTLRGGGLADAGLATYGDLLVAQSAELQRRGVPLAAITLGNEPGHSSDYTTMTMTVAQMAELGRRVSASLPASVALWAGDHNWEHRAAYDQLVAAAPGAFDGSAYHCYGGSPAQMDGPTPFRIITECTGTTDGWASTFAWQLRNLVAVPVANGSSGLLMWNLALDAANGPIDAGARWGCRTCRGLVRVDGSQVTPGPEFYLLGHLTRAAQPGARVLPVRSTAADAAVAAFRNPDGSTGVVGVNHTSVSQVVAVKVGTTTRRYVVGPGELFTYTTR
ncbi:hypothetical protein RDV89_13200 [Nocardioides zeae]|uniref:Glycosyl hydrolase family 30 TIM-barrel domain-containing protein n=1 Tax=Nocardioides imazamoxiresistens TaxID=3231893 RepID=A0ABU3PXR6_9ACTN|nr:hypothetical protein [Nocardioides zeae]MDT9594033.1 hypothetical protein [Nocardioides zeae]